MAGSDWLNMKEMDQLKWATKHLRTKGETHEGAPISATNFDAWLSQERTKDSALLLRMKLAWTQAQRRKADKNAKKKACSFVLSEQAKQKLNKLAKQNKSSITNFLESLLSDEYEQATQQKKVAKNAAKRATDKEQQLKKKLGSVYSALQECIKELTQRTVMMGAANLSIDSLSEEQKSVSAELYTETLKKLTDKSLMSLLDEQLSRSMERAPT
ncbi:hypothetical protein WG29040_05620 [Pseudomonas sp. PAMC 29040]|uniref:hypothetical protein n=1 Tax=Pseudomonas sp. PAMC 29040 TaxID=2498450 RepID=UPI000F9AC555|nr:hypothetical protein [Pseudomonas sp. PAMC 29040]RUT39797.1 hypothetical protein WG29040_05620 [Pseudomonas sp. PAMC 29040]